MSEMQSNIEIKIEVERQDPKAEAASFQAGAPAQGMREPEADATMED